MALCTIKQADPDNSSNQADRSHIPSCDKRTDLSRQLIAGPRSDEVTEVPHTNCRVTVFPTSL